MRNNFPEFGNRLLECVYETFLCNECFDIFRADVLVNEFLYHVGDVAHKTVVGNVCQQQVFYAHTFLYHGRNHQKKQSRKGACHYEESAEDSQNAYMEKDNVGTRQDSLEKANAYWLGTRLQMTEKPPFSLYVFKSATDAENALLELPFIHKAKDTGNLICEKVLEFGYYKVEADNYEAIITGFDYTLDDFNKAEESFKKHNGVLKNNLEPTDNANKTASVGGDKNNVKFRETITENQFTYECYDGKTKADAMAFLKDKEVNKGLYYVCVYTPEGNFGRDINGIYEM